MDGREVDRLLQKVAEGDNTAFEQLYVKTRRGIYAFIYSYLKNREDTEDVMQTVFLSVKKYISSYAVGTNGRAWLFQIAKNHALNELKRRECSQENEEPNVVYPEPEDGDIFNVIRNTLSEIDQQILILHVLWNYKHREIAKLLNCPIGTVTAKYKRAVEKLKNALKEDNL